MSLGVMVALRSALNEDVAGYIQQIANLQRREMMHELHAEYLQKLADLIEDKIDDIEMEMEETTLSEYGIRDLDEEKKMWEWTYVLTDIDDQPGKEGNSREHT